MLRPFAMMRAGVLAALVLVPAAAMLPFQDQAPSPATIALGDSIFHGKVGGALCFTCHGPKGKGINGLGPNLTDKEWTNGDGSIDFIKKTVTEGIPKPKKFPAPMPPKGGGSLNDSQIAAVAEYVYSLSHPSR